jgi:hypothetical protein
MQKTVRQAKIVVGMDRRNAARLLRGAGARATRIDAIMPRANTDDSGAVYEIPSGGLLMVSYHRDPAKASSQVSRMKLCQDPDAPKAKRVWTEVTQLFV